MAALGSKLSNAIFLRAKPKVLVKQVLQDLTSSPVPFPCPHLPQDLALAVPLSGMLFHSEAGMAYSLTSFRSLFQNPLFREAFFDDVTT